MIKAHSRKFCWIASLVLLVASSCAEISSPKGGPKDERPPEVIEAVPPMESTNFRGTGFIVEFDEYIQLKDVFNQVLVSPPFEKQPQYRLKGKKLMVSWDEPLLENRTYTFSFGQAIRDLNESNILNNFQYVFSTGESLDSLALAGTVKDARTDKPVEDYLVMLFPPGTDTIVRTTKPFYFARTDASGNFEMKYLAEGSYQLFALEDQNFNYRFDLPTEGIGFIDSILTVDTVRRLYSLEVFIEKQPVKVLSSKSTGTGKAEFIFSERVNPELFQLDASSSIQSSWTQTGDTLYAWAVDPFEDSITYRLELSDTTYRGSVRLRKPKSDSILRQSKLKIGSRLPVPEVKTSGRSVANTAAQDRPSPFYPLGQDFDLILPRPALLDTSRIVTLRIDTLEVDTIEIARTDEIGTRFRVEVPVQPDSEITLSLPAGTFTDLYGLSNDSSNFIFKLRPAAYYGKLNFKLQLHEDSSYVYQLLKGEEVIDSRWLIGVNDLELQYQYLPAATYQVELIRDDNKNGSWDPGNYALGIQSEEIQRFTENIQLRGEWELDFEWKP